MLTFAIVAVCGIDAGGATIGIFLAECLATTFLISHVVNKGWA
jgi:hypothetical protein